MAKIDWSTITSTNANYLTSVSGTAIQHNTLSSPITSSGTWFRGFQSTSTGATGGLIPINNSLLTSSVGYPYGYTYSLRCWARIQDAQANVSKESRIVLNFKNKSDLSVQEFTNSSHSYGLKGYSLILKEGNSNSNQGSLILNCINSPSSYGSPNSSLDAANNTNGYTYNIFFDSSQLGNKWTRLRMDVMSLPSSDRITIFTGSQTEGVWSQLHQVDIPRTKTAAYVPWYNNPSYNDNAAATTAGYMGIIHYNYNNANACYVDKFEVYREAIVL